MKITIKKHKAKLKYLVIAGLAALVLNSRGCRSLGKNYLEYRRLSIQKAELQREKLRLEKELKTIKEPANIDRTARRDLGMKRPDELEYRFEPPSEKDK
jgi:cell division protein FtsB